MKTKILTILMVTLCIRCNGDSMRTTTKTISDVNTLSDLSKYNLRPKGIVTDAQNNTYIAFFSGHIVGKFDVNDELVGWLGISPKTHQPNNGWQKSVQTAASTAEGAFNHPHTLKINQNSLFITEYGNNRVQRFSLDGQHLGTLGVTTEGQFTNGFTTGTPLIQTGTSNGLFKGISCIAFDNENSMYISDYAAGNITKFDHEFKYIGWIGKRTDESYNQGWQKTGSPSPSSELKAFRGTHGLTQGPDGFLYIADTHNHRILKYDKNGTFQAWLGKEQDVNPANTWLTHEAPAQASQLSGALDTPVDVAFDGAGNLFILEYGAHRVQKFSAAGIALGWIGAKSTGEINAKLALDNNPAQSSAEGGFFNPYHFEIVGDKLKVADSKNNRIQIFSLSNL